MLILPVLSNNGNIGNAGKTDFACLMESTLSSTFRNSRNKKLYYLCKHEDKRFINNLLPLLLFVLYLLLCSSECPSATVGTISNPNAIRCHMTSSCDQISCCIYLAPVKRHVEVVTKFNFCGYKMEARIDKLKDTLDLLDYVWGKFHTSHCLKLLGFRVLKFKCTYEENTEGNFCVYVI